MTARHDLNILDTRRAHSNTSQADAPIPAFLTSLRTNLQLNDCDLPSPYSTPEAMRASTSSLAEPTASPAVDAVDGEVVEPTAATNDENQDPLADVPPLSSFITQDADEKTAALKLIADSVAQMRQTASRSLIVHPLNSGLYLAFCAVLVQYMRSMDNKFSDPWLIITTLAGTTMTYLLTVRVFSGGYMEEAEKVKETLIRDADVFVTKFGDEVIGTCVVAYTPSPDEKKGKKRRGGKSTIRAWTVRMRYRGRGVGTALLEDAVAEARKRGAEDVDFADEHPSESCCCEHISHGA